MIKNPEISFLSGDSRQNAQCAVKCAASKMQRNAMALRRNGAGEEKGGTPWI
jgi:hypothetical protein